MKEKNIVESILLEEKKAKIALIMINRREEKGLKQEQLADLVGLSRNSIVRIENKRFFPKMETFFLILNALDLIFKIGEDEV